MRLFVAVDLPPEVHDQLDRLEVPMGGARWLADEQRHLTVRFIGEVDGGTFHEIADLLAEVGGAPFELRLKGLGHFPPRGVPQTLWVGVEPSAELNRMKAAVDRALREAGIGADPRRYLPHVTVARLRHPPERERFGSYLAQHSLFRSTPFVVQGFNLYSSILHPDGARYAIEARYDLMAVDHDEAF